MDYLLACHSEIGTPDRYFADYLRALKAAEE